MIKRNKRLLMAAAAALLFLCAYAFLFQGAYFAPGETIFPEISEEKAKQIVADYIQAERNETVDPEAMSVELFVNTETERYLEENGLLEAYNTHEAAPPISMWAVHFYDEEGTGTYFVDLMTGGIVGFLDTTAWSVEEASSADEQAIAEDWRAEHGLADPFKQAEEKLNGDGVVMHHFLSEQPVVGDSPLLLKVYTLNDAFVGFYPKLAVPDAYVNAPVIEGVKSGLSITFYIGYMGLIFIVGLIYWAMRATDQTLTVPVPLLTGIGLLLLSMAVWTTFLDVFLQGAIDGFLAFMAMLAVYTKKNALGSRSPERLGRLREKVFQGYLFGVLAFLPSLLFYVIATHLFGAWGSAQDEFVLLKSARWMALTPLFIGLAPAVTEELMFRKFGEFVFRRVWNNQIFIALVTSFIWATLHLGYAVHPWYLRIVELTLFVGPFLYWVYKKYGLTASMTAHYLFNCFLMSVTLIAIDAERYVYCLLFLLVPLIIYLVPAKRRVALRSSAQTYDL